MANERDPYPRAHQLLDLVDAVNSGRRLSINGIMKDCKVDRAAASRYLKFVQKRCELEHETRGGEKFWSKSVGKPGSAEFDDVVALELGLESARWLRGTPYFDLFAKQVDRLRQATDPKLADHLYRFVQSFHHRTQGDGTYSTKYQQIRELLRAIRDRRVCCIRYQPHSGAEQDYTIHPILLVLYKDRLYLFARKAETMERRSFVLESIASVRFQEDSPPFPPPTPRELDPGHVFEHSFGIYTDLAPPERVVVEVGGSGAMALRRQKLHATQELTEITGGWVRVTWHIAVCPELQSYLLALLPNVRVVAPDSLREGLRAIVESAFL